MKAKIYEKSEKYLIGLTLKDQNKSDENNMAFHVSTNKHTVLNNRKRLAQFLHTDLNDFVFANQTHSKNIYKVTRNDRGSGAFSANTPIKNVDALYTDEKNIVLCTLAADCVPVLFYHDHCEIIGAIHSGWRGTVQEITYHMFKHLINVEKCQPEYFHVYIGAAISQNNFEVDRDVYEKYKSLGYADDFINYKNKSNKYHIDNKAVVKEQCERVGIPHYHIKVDRMCTYTHETGFSYRENKTNGRHVGFIVKK